VFDKQRNGSKICIALKFIGDLVDWEYSVLGSDFDGGNGYKQFVGANVSCSKGLMNGLICANENVLIGLKCKDLFTSKELCYSFY